MIQLFITNISESQFEPVKMRITEKYKKTEKELLLKFRDASQENNVEQMQQMAETLSRKLFQIIISTNKIFRFFWNRICFTKSLFEHLKLPALYALC